MSGLCKGCEHLVSAILIENVGVSCLTVDNMKKQDETTYRIKSVDDNARAEDFQSRITSVVTGLNSSFDV